MYFQSLDPGLSQYSFATDCPPVSRILVAEHGACSKKYRHCGSHCVCWTQHEFVRGRHVASRSAHYKEINSILLLRLYPMFTSRHGCLLSLLLQAMLSCSLDTPFSIWKLHIILSGKTEQATFAEHHHLGLPMA